MKKLLLSTPLLAIFAINMPANAAPNPAQVAACTTQVTDKHITDATSAHKMCMCIVDEQAKITQPQKDDMDNWVKSGKNISQNKNYQTITGKIKACTNGYKLNAARN